MIKNIESKISHLYPFAREISFVENVKEGYLSQNYILQTSEQKFFLKQYSTKYSFDILKDVHRVKFFFEERGVPVILPYKNIKDETLFEHNEKYYTLFPFVEGNILPRKKLARKEICTLGKLLAQVHRLSDRGVPFSIQSEKGIWNSKKFLEESQLILGEIASIRRKSEFDRLAIKVLRKKIEIVKKNKLLPEDLGLKNDHLLHGDFHDKNIFFNDDGTVKYLFDWEKTCIGPRVFELVRAIDFICLDGEYKEENVDCARVFLIAYNQEYPIEKEEFNKGMTFYYIKKAHSLWIEREHYINKTERVDIFLEREWLMLDYYDENLKDLVDRLYEGICNGVLHFQAWNLKIE